MTTSMAGARARIGIIDASAVGLGVKRSRREAREYAGEAGSGAEERSIAKGEPLPFITKKVAAYVKKNLVALPLLPDEKIPAEYASYVKKFGIIPGLVKARLCDDLGDGIFAAEEIKKGSFIGVFAGATNVESPRVPERRRESEIVVHSDSGECLKIDSAVRGNFTRHIQNGGGFANVRATLYRDLASRVIVVLETSKDVPAGHQLLLAYGPERFSRVSVKPDTYTYDVESDSIVPPAVGLLDGVAYFSSHPEDPAYFEKRSLSALSRFRLPHVECPPRFMRAFHKIFTSALDLDAEKKAGSGLKFMRDAVADYEEVLGSKIPLPSFLQMASIPIGFGIFARENIAPNTFIGCFSGEIVENKDLEDPAYSFNLDSRFSIDAKRRGNYMRFVNHSKDHANVIFKYARFSDEEGNPVLAVLFFTVVAVSAGEQLLYDYEDSYDWISMIGTPPEEMSPLTYQLDLETGKAKAHGILRRESKPPKILDL